MDIHALTRQLFIKNQSKIVMYVADGLGGLPQQPGGLTELETARTPHLDKLAREGVLGLSIPVAPGIAPGSGPGHLGLFGYDPVRYLIGRGALEATGIGFKLEPGDVAIRANFCTLDSCGLITDRRAGRIASEQSAPLAIRLRKVSIPNVQVFVEPVKEHRFVIVLRGTGPLAGKLGACVNDTDPQAVGVAPLDPVCTDPGSEMTAQVAAEFVRQARALLADEPLANGLTLRGVAAKPDLPTYEEVYGLRAAAIAVYPMYKGLAQLVGMDVVGQAKTLDEQMDVLAAHWNDYDFFFIHFKYTDSTGEDGNFAAKVARTEEYDAAVPRIMALKPDVLIATGDHSTPSMLLSHSWHPVPTLLWSRHCRPDAAEAFGERDCLHGGLGQFEARHLMTLALANAGRLGKFGA
ncbi:MAG TPA: 2,3-bisphosphoglycerate-independent phosphoglycerate mutase [Lacipirellulaceae bacterium]|nr:2,3-bisphosphoglycerate-independent phosphoglycerate mutase [Lacipirellulaceae bacterium]